MIKKRMKIGFCFPMAKHINLFSFCKCILSKIQGKHFQWEKIIWADLWNFLQFLNLNLYAHTLFYLPCSPWNIISKFRHQSLTENPLVALIDWKNIYYNIIIQSSFITFQINLIISLTDSRSLSRLTFIWSFSW